VVLNVLLHLTHLESLAVNALGQLLDTQLHCKLRVLFTLVLLLLDSEVGHELFDLLLQGYIWDECHRNGHVGHGVGVVPGPEPLLNVGTLVGQARRGYHRVSDQSHANRTDELARNATHVKFTVQ